MRCPHCGQKLLQRQDGATQVRIKGRLLIKADGAHTQCFWCGSDVVIPLRMEDVERPPPPPVTKLILRKADKKDQTAAGGAGR